MKFQINHLSTVFHRSYNGFEQNIIILKKLNKINQDDLGQKIEKKI